MVCDPHQLPPRKIRRLRNPKSLAQAKFSYCSTQDKALAAVIDAESSPRSDLGQDTGAYLICVALETAIPPQAVYLPLSAGY